MGFIVSLLVLSFLIFFHELGHYLAARAFGIHVETFSIGFGKKLFSYTRNNTEYALSLIPLGGYVKMKGQNDAKPGEASNDSDSYSAKHPLVRIIVLVAGPLANLLLAALVYFSLALYGIDTLTSKIGQIAPMSAAANAGIQSNDKIISINGKTIHYWHQISPHIEQYKNKPLEVAIERNNTVKTVMLKAMTVETKNVFGEPITRFIIGITPQGESEIVHYSIPGAITFAYRKTVESSTFIALGLEKLVTGVVSLQNVVGVVSIVQVTNQAAHTGIVTLLLLTALISVNLGIINLLPIPALDGGHIIFNLYELITKKAPSEAVFTKLTLAGWAILLWLMLLGLYNDINRIFGGF